MAITPSKNPTKSIGWLSLDKVTQDKLIDILNQRQQEGLSEIRKDSLWDDLRYEIHTALGYIRGDYKVLNTQLEMLSSNCEGGIYDSVKSYLQKYYDIEAAVKQIVKEGQQQKDSRNL